MVKLNICAARIPGMTHAQYTRYLADNHARLVLGTQAVAQFLQSYVQQHVFDAAYGVDAPNWRFDSVSHICAPTVADHMAATKTPEYREQIAPDEQNFADSRSATFMMFDEQPLPLDKRGPSRCRLLHYVRRAPGVSAADLMTGWAAAHAQVQATEPRLLASVRRAVLNHSLPGPGGAPALYDGMCELGFVAHDDASTMADYVRHIEAELAPLMEPTSSFYLLADAVPVRGTLD